MYGLDQEYSRAFGQDLLTARRLGGAGSGCFSLIDEHAHRITSVALSPSGETVVIAEATKSVNDHFQGGSAKRRISWMF
jgi:hypothetical protein